MLNKLKLVVGIVLMMVGLVTAFYSFDAYQEATAELASENIVTPDDASIPGVPVNDIKTAVSQAEIIQEHILERTEGKTYAEMDREDPNRESYTRAVVLRTSLFSAALALGLAQLGLVLGAVAFLVGGVFAAEGYVATRR